MEILISLFCYEKCIDLCEYMDSGERLLPKKENFYSSLNMEDVTNIDHRHAKKVIKIFNNKNTGEYHDLYLESDTLLLSHVLENFRDKSIEINELYPAWEAWLKKTKLADYLLTDIDMLLMVEKRIWGEMCHAIHRYANANNKYMKNYNKNEKIIICSAFRCK